MFLRLLKEVIPLDILFVLLYFLIIDGKCTSDIVNSSVIGGTLGSICLFCMTYVFKMKLNWRYHNWRYHLIYIMSDLTTNANFRNIFTWFCRGYYKPVRTISTFNFTHIFSNISTAWKFFFFFFAVLFFTYFVWKRENIDHEKLYIWTLFTQCSERAHCKCSIEKLYLKISQILQKNTCTRVSFLIW